MAQRASALVLHALRLEVTLQLRNGFYYAVAVVLAITVSVFLWLGPELVRLFLPVAVFGNFLINGALFMGAIALLERDQGVDTALAVTPLGRRRNIAAKVFSLVALGLTESLVLALLGGITLASWAALIAGTALGTAALALLGLLLATRYGSINALVLPLVAWGMLAMAPILDYFSLTPEGWMALHPLQPAMVLLGGAVAPIGIADWLYALGYGFAAVTALFLIAGRRAMPSSLVP